MSIATELTKLQNNLSDSYTAVQSKGGTIPQNQCFDNLPTAINSIVTGITPSGTINITTNNTYDVTTYASAVVNVDTVNNTNLSVTPLTTAQSFTVAAPYTGYYTVSVSAVTSSIDSNIKASNIKSGISILGVNGSVVELNADSVTINPSTSSQTITPTSPVNGFDEITVNPVTSSIDANISAGNIKSGVSILGVSGTVTELNGSSRSVTLTSASGQTFNPETGKNAITSITVSPNNQARTLTATTSQQTFTVGSGYSGNGTITLNAVTSAIDSNIKATNIKSGVNILGVNGSVVELAGETRTVSITSTSGNTFTPSSGKNGITSIKVTPTNQNRTVTPTTSQQTLSVNSGYSGNGTITVNAVTSAIDSDIKATNIKSGVNILGVNGSVVELAGETRSVSITSTSGNTFTPSSGKNGITSIKVTPTNQAKTITPTTSQQSISVPSGYSGFGSLTVNAVTSSIDANITAGNIKNGVTILGITGTYEGANINWETFMSSHNSILGNSNYVIKQDGSIENFKNGSTILPIAETQMNNNSFNNAYGSNTTIIAVSLAAITQIGSSTNDGSYAPLSFTFSDATNLEYINIDSLQIVGGMSVFANAFTNTKIKKLNFKSLNTLYPFYYAGIGYMDNPVFGPIGGNIEHIYFPALNSTSFKGNSSFNKYFNNMLKNINGCTVHFPSNLQSKIGNWSSVTSGFSGTNTTVLFDLSATT